MQEQINIESLPVELIVEILGELDLKTLINISYLSRRLHRVSSDISLNPWRRPILRTLRSEQYEDALRNLSVRSIAPRHNWIDILSIAKADYLLYEATLPNLSDADWEESFRRRFLPGWIKWRRDRRWKEVFMKMTARVVHRNSSSCAVEESWTKYIVLSRKGNANLLEGPSRNFSPLAIFNEMKLQSNLAHLETRARLVVQFADVRIIAIGVLNKPRSQLTVNANARAFLHPPGVERGQEYDASLVAADDSTSDTSYSLRYNGAPDNSTNKLTNSYTILKRPLPSPAHSRYPFFTPSGRDKRWLGPHDFEEMGRQWVGGLMLTAQLVSPHMEILSSDGAQFQDLDLLVGPGRNQYASFIWEDFATIAPWMEERIKKKIDGPGLGL